MVTLDASAVVTSTELTARGSERSFVLEEAARLAWDPIASVTTIATSVAVEGRRRIGMLFLSPACHGTLSPHWGHWLPVTPSSDVTPGTRTQPGRGRHTL